MRFLLSVLLLVCAAWAVAAQHFAMPSPWSWECQPQADGDGRCVRNRLTASVPEAMSLETCKITCGKCATLWPEPKSGTISKTVHRFHPDKVANYFVDGQADRKLLNEASNIFLNNIKMLHPDCIKNKNIWDTVSNASSHSLNIYFEITRPSTGYLKLDTRMEAYDLQIDTQGMNTIVKIIASSFFGARHGLESLSQLIEYDDTQSLLQVVSFATIHDQPSYPYRGILLDTSRNFITVEAIKRTLDGMAANKLNTFHWHITDSHSFPMVLKTLPKMAYLGAYSSRQLYHPEDIRHIVQYGRVRGIRVLPEFDAPAHVGHGWEWGPEEGLGDLAVCVAQEPWQDYCVEPPCGQLNIANQNIYPVLGKIYKEMAEMFGPLDLFHYGGDEVNLNCWNTTEEIVNFMLNAGNKLTADSYYNQWSHFQNRAYQLLTQANDGVEVPGILWTSHLTEKGRTDQYLDKNKYIIQIWSTGEDPLIKELLDKKYRVIFSNYDAWYLDCGFGAWVGEGNNWCSPYKGWQKVYDNSPRKIALNLTNNAADLSLILGGEVALWTEQADSHSIDGRLWPRAAALAERLWSDPDHNWAPAEYRMVHHRQRLVKRGISADRLQPEWCHQHEGLCYLRGNELP